ncbi:MAG: hypothetical protein A3B11_01150 [Candidatus Taylorbacteria bacterium RIFCSPLOWO2_01_FULL_44_26]|uniref:Uncharacterized protein n=2 Tax=Candidatus Tayloriibacteriota TaxID=1817919 RepID=A0A1G2MJ31_9BACT|nr:MAG: hypothetical protein A3D50_00930 [Candidatus Taylorbacteria bacterium RIFCSPHIGHO2_02_FULL_44_12]OHA30707.1 MAG: hypothetical protein A3B11_01150 [Candidatus Taylorbacteria bacterium RIFCSPLOWO2_01_FULL_44_26]
MLLGLYLAFFAHSSIWYSFFVIGGFFLLEGINSKKDFSLLKNYQTFLYTWLLFVLITILTEIIGNFLLNAWTYPYFGLVDYFIHVILIGYPFTFFFAMEFFVLVKRYTSSKLWWFILPISAIIFGYLNELPNIFAYEWRYSEMFLGNFLGIPILISILWLLILLVQLFEKLFFDRKKVSF